MEPIQGTGGYVIPPLNFFSELKKVLDKYGILLVVDEIQMGVFRTGKMWSIEHFGVTPDVLVFGKAITNGLNPLSGIWAREELINPGEFPPGSTHSTFASNPMGTAVALEAVKMLGENDFGASVLDKGAYFLDQLKDLQKRHKIVGDVDGLGLALRIEITGEDRFTPDKAMTDRIVDIAMLGDARRRQRREVGARARYRRLLQERDHAGAGPYSHEGGDRSRRAIARSELQAGDRQMRKTACRP